MINLLIDIGNSSVKASFAQGVNLEDTVRYGGTDVLDFIMQLAKKKKALTRALKTEVSEDFYETILTLCSEESREA